MASGDTKTESLLNILGNGGSIEGISGCANTKTQNYIIDAINRIQNVENEVEELKNNPDVVDIVDTYADLQTYDTSTLTDKDIIRVLEDSTHSNGSTYYRWNATTNQFDYIGEAGGGGGGPTMFYAPFDIYQSQVGDISIYLDESLTQAATGGDFYDAMAKYGQVILCALPSYIDNDYHKVVSVSVHQPYEKSVTAFDSYPPEAYFAILDYPGFVSATLGFNSADPDTIAFSYNVNTQ